jgi:arabinogalactan oligomer/maltooligosaccharide transport system permease protein
MRLESSTTTSPAAAPLARPQPRAESRVNALLQPKTRGIIIRQIFIQLFLLTMLVIVVFPLLWIVSMAIDPRGVARPTDLNLLPTNATLDAFTRLLREPFSNVLPIYFGDMLVNSLFVALGTSLFTVTAGASAAYAFSRFKFIGRKVGMLGFILLIMLPTTGALIPLFVLFNGVRVNSWLASAVPIFFTSGFIAALAYILYRLVRGLMIQKDPDKRTWSPRLVIGGLAVISFLAIWLTFFIIFERSPLYDTVVNQPLETARAPLLELREDITRDRDGTANRERRADGQQEDLEFAQAEQAAFTMFVEDARATDDLAALLAGEIDVRQAGEDPEDDVLLQAYLVAQDVLEADGAEAAITTLETDGAAQVQAVVDEAAEDAASALATFEEAAAELALQEEELTRLEDDYSTVSSRIGALRWDYMNRALPQIVLVWIGTLAAAGGVFGLLYALGETVNMRRAIDFLAIVLCSVLLLGIGVSALTNQMSGVSASSTQSLRTTLLGLSMAFASGGLPFAIWNLKGYFDTIPKDLEEAARIDGASAFSTFFYVMLPLALPAFAITILFSFMSGWTEFILSWLFLTGNTGNYTLAMALATLVNGGNTAPPDMQKFAAMSILISLPILILFFTFQRWIVSGLSIGAVKG